MSAWTFTTNRLSLPDKQGDRLHIAFIGSGANNLSSYLLRDYYELLEGSAQNKHVDITALRDTVESTSPVSAIRNGVPFSEDLIGEITTNDRALAAQFFEWGWAQTRLYPDILIVAGHGDGRHLALDYDVTNRGEAKGFTGEELKEGIRQIPKAPPVIILEVCLGMDLFTINSLLSNENTKAVVGSSGFLPASGIDLVKFIKGIGQGKDFKGIVTTYLNSRYEKEEFRAPLSAYNSEVAQVVVALGQYFTEIGADRIAWAIKQNEVNFHQPNGAEGTHSIDIGEFFKLGSKNGGRDAVVQALLRSQLGGADFGQGHVGLNIWLPQAELTQTGLQKLQQSFHYPEEWMHMIESINHEFAKQQNGVYSMYNRVRFR